jgi:DNA-binding NtrC family response regulator
VLTGHGPVDSDLESGHENSYHYLLKPVEFESLMQTIRDAYHYKIKLQRKESAPQEKEPDSDSGSSKFKKAVRKIRNLYGVRDD